MYWKVKILQLYCLIKRFFSQFQDVNSFPGQQTFPIWEISVKLVKTATFKVVFGSENYERKGLPLYFLLYFIPLHKTQNISKKQGGRGVRSILATPKYTLKSAFLAVFYKNVQFCQLLTTYISMTVQNLSKILFVSIFWMLSNVF